MEYCYEEADCDNGGGERAAVEQTSDTTKKSKEMRRTVTPLIHSGDRVL